MYSLTACRAMSTIPVHFERPQAASVQSEYGAWRRLSGVSRMFQARLQQRNIKQRIAAMAAEVFIS